MNKDLSQKNFSEMNDVEKILAARQADEQISTAFQNGEISCDMYVLIRRWMVLEWSVGYAKCSQSRKDNGL